MAVSRDTDRHNIDQTEWLDRARTTLASRGQSMRDRPVYRCPPIACLHEQVLQDARLGGKSHGPNKHLDSVSHHLYVGLSSALGQASPRFELVSSPRYALKQERGRGRLLSLVDHSRRVLQAGLGYSHLGSCPAFESKRASPTSTSMSLHFLVFCDARRSISAKTGRFWAYPPLNPPHHRHC